MSTRNQVYAGLEDTGVPRTGRFAIWRPLAVEAPYLLVVLAASLLAASRLLGPGLVSSADGELHLYRAFALDRALQQGLLFPRVLPDLLFGYGYPLFNYYPPASAYMVELLHLFGLGFVTSLRVAYGASFVLAGVTMYAFAHAAFAAHARQDDTNKKTTFLCDRLRAASVAAAVAYVVSPYFLINVYTRGALAEALVMPIFPALLLAVQRLVSGKGQRAIPSIAILTALLVLTHSALAMFFLPMVGGYGLVASRGQCEARRTLFTLIAGLTLGLALSAFFWLPAWLERGEVNAQNLQSGFYDVHHNFVQWSALVARTLFYPATEPLPIPPRLGPFQVLLALSVLPLLAKRGSLPRLIILYWLAVGAISLFLITPNSASLWETLPLVAGLSFPWRLLSFVTLAVAMIAGFLVLSLRLRYALPVALAVVLLSVATALPGITPTFEDISNGTINLANYWRFEFETSMVGTTSANEYLPKALRAGSYVLPRVPDDSYTSQSQGAPLPATIHLLEYGAQRLRLEVDATAPTSIVAHAVYFPGWQTSIDGTQVTPYPSTPLGLVTVAVPRGTHELTLYYGQSGVAAAGNFISLLALLATGLLLFVPVWPVARRRRIVSRKMVAGAVSCGLIVAAFALLPSLPRLWSATSLRTPGSGASALSDDVDLIGWSAPRQGEGSLDFNLYWLARRTPLRNEVVVVTLRDAQRQVRARWERQPQYGYSATLRWVLGEIVPDEYALPLPADLPAGEYTVEVGLRGSANAITLGTAHLAGVPAKPAAPRPAPSHVLPIQIGDGMRLLGYDIGTNEGTSESTPQPGKELTVTLYWQSTGVLDRDYTVFLHLLDQHGAQRAQHDAQPQDGRRPTLLWQPGEQIIDQHRLSLPSDLPAGRYQLIIGVYFRPTMKRLDVFDSDGHRIGDFAQLATIDVR